MRTLKPKYMLKVKLMFMLWLLSASPYATHASTIYPQHRHPTFLNTIVNLTRQNIPRAACLAALAARSLLGGSAAQAERCRRYGDAALPQLPADGCASSLPGAALPRAASPVVRRPQLGRRRCRAQRCPVPSLGSSRSPACPRSAAAAEDLYAWAYWAVRRPARALSSLSSPTIPAPMAPASSWPEAVHTAGADGAINAVVARGVGDGLGGHALVAAVLVRRERQVRAQRHAPALGPQQCQHPPSVSLRCHGGG
eukprot:COSAG01_NODE_778_length_13681_cov_15.265130_15_plen_254_part_00